MTNYQAKYDTRLLYTQSYTTEDDVQVSSTTYAVIWALTNNEEPVSSRLRVTLLYKNENTVITPVQGLVEQWKSEGWTPMDEFADSELVFDTHEDFQNHMMTMARSFILGIPLNSTVETPPDTPDDPVNTRTFDTNDKRFKNVNSKIKNLKGLDLKGKTPSQPGIEETATKDEGNSSDDDDDDDWL